ncbi:protein piccolo-like isoform X2 [Fundulus heteroclitus]|uniref:protein piccolo-like isoform X2 n=1 Tax=Fundulus heteroclitus TaxID=8078 RepID=UPI00165C4E7C|nr:protein piccolo-like isoform X2 [Fundulus heteroclitus]
MMLPEKLSQPEQMSAAAAMAQTSRPPSQEGDVVTGKDVNEQNQTASPSARPESAVNRLKRKIRRFFTKYHRRHSAKVVPLNSAEGPEICGATANPAPVHQAKPPQRSGDVPPEHFAPDGRSSPSDEDESVTYVEEFIAEEASEVTQNLESEPKFDQITPVEAFVPEDEASEVPSVPDSGPESPSTEVTQNLESEPKFDQITPVEAFFPEDEASEVPSVEDVPADSQASVTVGEEEELTDLRQPEVCPAVAEPTVPRATAEVQLPSSIEKRLLKSSNVKKIFDMIQETLKDSAPRLYMVL